MSAASVMSGGKDASEYTPRAQRFPVVAPMRYRLSGEADWSEGTTINMSRSGILFHSERDLEPKAMVEMEVLFPSEITGGVAANVLCWGPIIRSEPPREHEKRSGFAAAILHYRFRRVS